MRKLGNKREKGITLIALVVTIVVLIILATISINAVIGQGGIIQKAKDAKDFHDNAQVEELTKLEEMANGIAKYYTGEISSSGAGSEVTKPDNWDNTKVTPISDGKGGTVPLPNEFYYVGGDIDTGIVISDKPNDTMNASGTNMGNQFVWIPVAKDTGLTRTVWDEDGQIIEEAEWADYYKEPLTSGGYSTEETEFNTMKTQVLKYGGFYIGRFEAGVNNTTLRSGATAAQTVVCKKGVAPYNYVPWGISMSNAGEVAGASGAVYLAKNIYSKSNSVVSTLTYACQWDTMCRYIGDGGRTTTEKEPELTGSLESDKSKNIYDLAGNCSEWTMEAYATYRTARGGGSNQGSSNAIRDRVAGEPNAIDETFSFRPALYIK